MGSSKSRHVLLAGTAQALLQSGEETEPGLEETFSGEHVKRVSRKKFSVLAARIFLIKVF